MKKNRLKILLKSLAGEKTDKLNEELMKEYLENMEKNVVNAVKFCNKEKNGQKKVEE